MGACLYALIVATVVLLPEYLQGDDLAQECKIKILIKTLPSNMR